VFVFHFVTSIRVSVDIADFRRYYVGQCCFCRSAAPKKNKKSPSSTNANRINDAEVPKHSFFDRIERAVIQRMFPIGKGDDVPINHDRKIIIYVPKLHNMIWVILGIVTM
jgi:hypothetical protein